MNDKNIVEYKSGEIIFKELEKGDELYILAEGRVELTKKVEKGKKLLKVVDVPNEIFGEMALIDDSPRSATATAVQDSRLVAVKQAAFEHLIMSNGNFALKIIKMLSDRIRNSNIQISELVAEVPKERIYHGMVDFALHFGEQIFNKGYKVNIRKMTEWINGHIGVSRKDFENTLYRLLKTKEVSYAAKSEKTKDELILPENFIERFNRRQSV
jgi:CRP/FNR family transcriptional regulator